MKVSDYISEFLVEQNIDKVFSYIGKNAHICDSIDKHEKIENIFTIHEQGAGFSAAAYARVTGKSGVVTVTSGPGATNIVTPLADCYFDSIPALYIVGDLSTDELKGSRAIRQFGFQETDMVKVVDEITKYAVNILELKDIRYEFEKAYFLSQHGRKGPVLISLPENLQFRDDFEPENEKSFFDSLEYKALIDNSPIEVSDKEINSVVELINSASRAVILVGGGVRLSDSRDELKKLLKKSQIPIVYSLMGKDSLSSDYKYNLGFIGNFGTRHANLTIANADLIIVLGSRLEILQTGRDIESFRGNAKVIQVDIDKNELGSRVDADLSVHADIKRFLKALNGKKVEPNLASWHKKVLEYKERYPCEYALDGSDRVGNILMKKISEHLDDDDVISVDVGEHQMLVAQSLDVKKNQRILFSGAFGAMGFALPAAIGAALATGKRAIVISGDGGLQMNIQELEVIKRRALPIKILVINNASLHMVKLRQDAYLEGNLVGSQKDYSVPSFKKIAEAYGIKSSEVTVRDAIDKKIADCLKSSETELIDIEIPPEMTTVEPRLDFNRAFADMRPHLSREKFREEMLHE
jgi:acetolactate synthase-1/2/3 large subunit